MSGCGNLSCFTAVNNSRTMDLSGQPIDQRQAMYFSRRRTLGDGDDTTQINSRFCIESSIESIDRDSNSNVMNQEFKFLVESTPLSIHELSNQETQMTSIKKRDSNLSQSKQTPSFCGSDIKSRTPPATRSRIFRKGDQSKLFQKQAIFNSTNTKLRRESLQKDQIKQTRIGGSIGRYHKQVGSATTPPIYETNEELFLMENQVSVADS